MSLRLLKMALLGSLLWPLAGQAIEASELLAIVDRNLQPESSEMVRKLINIEPDGNRKEFVLFTVKKGRDNMAMLFLDPPSEKGRATLRIGDNMWLYIPNVGKPLRITSLQSVVGGVFNNSDILRVDFAAEYDPLSLVESDAGYVMQLKAKGPNVAYDKLTMSIDKKYQVPTRIEAYAASGLLIKTLHYSNIKEFSDGIVRPAVLETDSPLNKGFKSVMVYATVKKRVLSDEVFSLNYMGRLDDLR